MVAILSLQLFYWKFATGKWFYDTYGDDGFLFNSPQILDFLFSFRKGFFVYTPIMLFALFGLIPLHKINRLLFYATVLIFSAAVYVLSSWLFWSYGICWGMRPMIDFYAILSLPMAASFSVMQSGIKKFIKYALIVLLILLNLFQTWQYKNGLIHFDDMSREAYFKGFLQTTTPSVEWYDALKPYNWERRKNGLEQIDYSSYLFRNLPEKQAVFFRGKNLLYVSASAQAEYVLTCYFNEVTNDELFYIHQLGGDTIAIKAANGKFLSCKTQPPNLIVADANSIGVNEKFITVYDENNKVSFKTINSKWLKKFEQTPNFILASDAQIEKETFRYFLKEDYCPQLPGIQW